MHKHKYSDCSFCGGEIKATKVKADIRWKDKLYVFENVPAGVCQQCGEQYFTAQVAKKLESSIERNSFRKFLEVPVSSFSN